MPESLFAWLAVAVALFWFVGAHNRLVRLRSAVMQAFGGLDAALQRQIEFIQARLAAESSPTEVAAPADGARSSLAAAVTQFLTVLAATRQRPLDPAAVSALQTALHVVLAAWQRLHPHEVVSFHTDGMLARADTLSGALVPVTLPRERDPLTDVEPLGWPEPSAAAEIARGQFNQAVATYNAAIRQFPAVLLAWTFRLRQGDLLR